MFVLNANQWLCSSHSLLKSRCFLRHSSSSSTLDGLGVYLTHPSSILFLGISAEEPCGGDENVHAALPVSVCRGLPNGAQHDGGVRWRVFARASQPTQWIH